MIILDSEHSARTTYPDAYLIIELAASGWAVFLTELDVIEWENTN